MIEEKNLNEKKEEIKEREISEEEEIKPEEVEKWEVEEVDWIKEVEKLRKKIKRKIAKHYGIEMDENEEVVIMEVFNEREKTNDVVIFVCGKEYKDNEFNKKILREYLEKINEIIDKYNLLEHWPVEYYTHVYYHDEKNTRGEGWTIYLRDNDNNMLLYFDEWVESDVYSFNYYVERKYYL